MKDDHLAHQAAPFPRERQLIIEGGRFTRRFKELIESGSGLADLTTEKGRNP